MFVYLIAWYVSHARAQELERSLLSEDLELPERVRPGASAASAMNIVTVIHDCIDDSHSNSSLLPSRHQNVMIPVVSCNAISNVITISRFVLKQQVG